MQYIKLIEEIKINDQDQDNITQDGLSNWRLQFPIVKLNLKENKFNLTLEETLHQYQMKYPQSSFAIDHVKQTILAVFREPSPYVTVDQLILSKNIGTQDFLTNINKNMFNEHIEEDSELEYPRRKITKENKEILEQEITEFLFKEEKEEIKEKLEFFYVISFDKQKVAQHTISVMMTQKLFEAISKNDICVFMDTSDPFVGMKKQVIDRQFELEENLPKLDDTQEKLKRTVNIQQQVFKENEKV
jgi:hypothetical protein